MNTKYFCSGLALAGRLGPSAVLLGGLLLSSISAVAQHLPAPPPPPPSPSSVVHAIQGAANQAAGAVTDLTADQKQKAEAAKRQLEAQLKAAVEALRIRVNQRVTQLNTYYSDQRKARQASQKALLNQGVMVKASGLATVQRAPVGKITANTPPASGSPSPRPMPGGASPQASSSASGAPTAPTIANLSATSGEPGDPILVTGTGFTAATEVYFLVAPNRQEKATVGLSSDTQMMVEVPLATGLLAFNGAVLVKREDGQVSQGSPFRFNPRMVVMNYNFQNVNDVLLHNDVHLQSETFSGYATEFQINHRSRPFEIFGFKVDDTLFPNTRLKNSWIVEDIILDDPSSAVSRVQLQENAKGTNSLRMKVHGWTVNPVLGIYMIVDYAGSVLVRGPEELSYK
jgi:uncharacterized protein YjbJ (UPF0337 family)